MTINFQLMTFCLMRRRGRTMTYMEMRKELLDLTLAVLEIMVDIHTSQVVDQDKVGLTSVQVVWVDKEVQGHSLFPLVVLAAKALSDLV